MVDWEIFVSKLNAFEARGLWDVLKKAYPSGVATYPLPPLSKEEKALAPNRRIAAIKMYKDRTSCGLKEAKDMVQAYLHRDPLQDIADLVKESEKP